MNEKLTIDNNFELFYHNLTKIYKRFLFEDYNNITIKTVSVKRDNNWNIEYILFELTTEGRNLKQITYSENNQILLYENAINIDDFFKFFLKEGKNWIFVDNDLKLLFNYPISFDTSDDNLMQKIESNCFRQRIQCSKQIHLEYINFFRVLGTAFSYKIYDEEDFIDDDNNLIKAHEFVRDFLSFKLNSLGNPAIFISYPIESFQLSKRIDFQESMLNLSLICKINEYYRDKIMPVYIKEGQRKIFSQEEEIIQIPYDNSGQINISIYTRSQFGVSSSKETLFKEILDFPEVMIVELINKLKSVENNENYKKYYEISKNITQTIGYNEDLKSKIENLKPDPLLFGMNGTEYAQRTWILPLDYEKLQNKKDELIKFLENIKKPKESFPLIHKYGVKTILDERSGYPDLNIELNNQLRELDSSIDDTSLKNKFFPFLKPTHTFKQDVGQKEYFILQDKLEKIKEKCAQGIAAQDCEKCEKIPNKICLTKLFSYPLGKEVLPHCGAELADCFWISKNDGNAIVIKGANLRTKKQYMDPLSQINDLTQRNTVKTIFFANNNSTSNQFLSQALNLCKANKKQFITFNKDELIQFLHFYETTNQPKEEVADN